MAARKRQGHPSRGQLHVRARPGDDCVQAAGVSGASSASSLGCVGPSAPLPLGADFSRHQSALCAAHSAVSVALCAPVGVLTAAVQPLPGRLVFGRSPLLLPLTPSSRA